MRIGAVDAGQSGTRGVVIEPDGARSPVHETGGVRHLARPNSPTETGRRVVEALGQIAGPLDALGVGISGFDQDHALTAAVDETIRAGVRASKVILTSDSVTSFVGAVGTRPGVVVAGGTGLVCLAADGAGRWAWVDGAGFLLGDEGGGSWIGRRGLLEAVRVSDGRGGSRVLADLAEQRFGPVTGLPAVIYGAEYPAAVLASFVPDVATAAAEGDDAAEAIWTEAAALIARAIRAGIGRVRPGAGRLVVACTGSLFTPDLPLATLIGSILEADSPEVDLVRPAGSSLDGAICLARDPAVGALFPGLVHVFDRPAGSS